MAPASERGWYRKRNHVRKVAFALQMGTRRPISVLVVAAGLLAAACGGGPAPAASPSPTPGPTAAQSPSAGSSGSPPAEVSPSPAPQPLKGAYGVLVSPVTGSGSYTVAIVGVDGKVAASAQATSPTTVSCANSAAAVVPLPVSTSDTRLYCLDAAGAVRTLAPDGTSTGAVITLPAGTASRRSMFAVSPDDNYIAVVVDDFTQGGATTNLYVDELNAPVSQKLIFSESGAYTLWPIGWHGTNNLVVAKVPSCTQGGGPFCCGPLELHVIDPATATRRFTIGNSSSCVIAGSPSPAGAVCENSPDFTQAAVLNWTAGTVRTLAINGPAYAYVNPGGSMIALVDNNGTEFTIGAAAMSGVFACAWIDDTHILAGGDTQHQPRVADVTSGVVSPVAAQGDCGGRLPGGL